MTKESEHHSWCDEHGGCHDGALLDEHNGYRIIDCESCGFSHSVPIPSAAELDTIYREQYYSNDNPRYLENHRQDQEWWELVYRERYQRFEEWLPSSRRQILDVGSGPGYFLHHGKERGWQPLGLEPSQHAAEYARGLGLEIEQCFLERDTIEHYRGRFDVVNLSKVLEHVPQPATILELAASTLRPGGIICLVVPNDYNPLQLALRDGCDYDPWWVAPPHHINYFNPDSLSGLVERCGFEVLAVETTFPIDLFLLMGENYVADGSLGRACHAKRKALELNLERAGRSDLKQALYQSFAEHGLGREVVLYARLPA